jgi:hypothetical protein
MRRQSRTLVAALLSLALLGCGAVREPETPVGPHAELALHQQ